MNSIRCSEGSRLLAIAVVALLAVTVVAVPVAAVTVEQTKGPSDSGEAVGTEITVTYRITDVYDPAANWKLNGTTNLQNVTGWNIRMVTPSGKDVSPENPPAGQQSFQVAIKSSQNLEYIEVSITGTVPPVEEYTYEPPQTFVAANFDRIRGNNRDDLKQFEIHHFTQESARARDTIDAAVSAGASGSDLVAAKSAFRKGNFENAIRLAKSAKNSAQTGQLLRNALLGVGVLIVLAAIGGGIYYWRSQQNDYDRLR
ncbi:MAG: hypothetical protein ABEJ86_03610 [Halococcoides sp.]